MTSLLPSALLVPSSSSSSARSGALDLGAVVWVLPEACEAYAVAGDAAAEESLQSTRRARVVDVQPVYHYREQHNGYHSCIRRDSGRAGYRSWTPAVLGAVIGGAVGHSLGDSYGDADAAAIAGGVLGAAVGRDVGRHHAQAGAISSSGPCRVSARDSAWRRPVEYVVTYRYNGQIYRTRMEHHPGEWVELDADKRPT